MGLPLIAAVSAVVLFVSARSLHAATSRQRQFLPVRTVRDDPRGRRHPTQLALRE